MARPKQGRPSKAAQEVATLAAKVNETQIVSYAEAPYELGEAESYVWNSVVQCNPPDWFSPATYPLLMAYCRHVVAANHIADWITAELEDAARAAGGQATYGNYPTIGIDKLLTMQAQQSRAIAMLATKMRLAQQSTIDEASKRANVGRKRSTTLWARPSNS